MLGSNFLLDLLSCCIHVLDAEHARSATLLAFKDVEDMGLCVASAPLAQGLCKRTAIQDQSKIHKYIRLSIYMYICNPIYLQNECVLECDLK